MPDAPALGVQLGCCKQQIAVGVAPHAGNEGKWVKFHVMREDSNDGKLILKTKMAKGGNLMITKIVLSKE